MLEFLNGYSAHVMYVLLFVLLLLCGLDVPTLKNVRLSLQTLELLSFPPDRIKLVLNRANSKVGMKPKEVEAALEREIAYEVPSDRTVPLAVNRGNPAVLSDPKADFSRAVRAKPTRSMVSGLTYTGTRPRTCSTAVAITSCFSSSSSA